MILYKEKKYSLFIVSILTLFCTPVTRPYNKRKSINAGVLPYAYDCKGTPFILLGQEPNGLWADFGGRYEKGETPFQTAVREWFEETRGAFVIRKSDKPKKIDSWFLFWKPIKKWTTKQMDTFLCRSKAYALKYSRGKYIHPKGYYVMYVLETPKIPIKRFTTLPHIPHEEKTAYQWVPAKELLSIVESSTDRWNTFYKDMHLRRQLVDMLKTYASDLRLIMDIER